MDGASSGPVTSGSPSGGGLAGNGVIPVKRLLEAGVHLAPMDSPDSATRDAGRIAHWLAERRELGISVGERFELVGMTVLGADVEGFERDEPWHSHTACIDLCAEGVPHARTYLHRRPAGAFAPGGVRAVGLDELEVVPLPPTEGAQWVRGPGRILVWPWRVQSDDGTAGRHAGDYQPGERFRQAAISPWDLYEDDPELPESVLGDGLLPADGLAGFAGPPGAGKTRVGLDLAYCLASGKPWLGICTSPQASKRVLVLSLEITRPRLNQVQKALFHARSEYDRAALTDRVRVITFDALGGLPGSILEQRVREDIAAYAREFDFLLLDPLYLLVPGNLRDEEIGKATVEALMDLRQRSGCAIVFVHHERKLSAAGDRGSAIDRMFGSVFLSAALDLQIALGWKDRRAGVRELEFGKVRYAAAPDPLYLRMAAGGVPTLTEKPDARSARARERRGEILEVLASADRPLSRAEMAAILMDDSTDEAAARMLQRDLGKMVGAEAIAVIGSGPGTRYVHVSRLDRDTSKTDRDITT